MAILGTYNWECINNLRKRDNPEKRMVLNWFAGVLSQDRGCRSAEGIRKYVLDAEGF